MELDRVDLLSEADGPRNEQKRDKILAKALKPFRQLPKKFRVASTAS